MGAWSSSASHTVVTDMPDLVESVRHHLGGVARSPGYAGSGSRESACKAIFAAVVDACRQRAGATEACAD
jgi:hypothetical protein